MNDSYFEIRQGGIFQKEDSWIQTQFEWESDIDHISVMPVDKKTEQNREVTNYESKQEISGETFMERQLTENRGLTFMGMELTGTPRIGSSADVAFLFKNLESAATENAFLVMIRPDETYGVYYSSTGGTNLALVDTKLLIAAAREFGASKVCFVHNHPSGSLRASPLDIDVHKSLRGVMNGAGIEMMGSVIINLDSGNYLLFNESEKEIKEKGVISGKTIIPKIYQFDRSVFYKPSSERTVIRDPNDIAMFLSKQKRGIVPKLSAMVLDSGNNINKYLFIDPAMSREELVATLTYEVGKHGNSVVLSSNAGIDRETLRFIQNGLSLSGITLLDVLQVKQNEDILNNFISYASEGVMEPGLEYALAEKKLDDSEGKGNDPKYGMVEKRYHDFRSTLPDLRVMNVINSPIKKADDTYFAMIAGKSTHEELNMMLDKAEEYKIVVERYRSFRLSLSNLEGNNEIWIIAKELTEKYISMICGKAMPYELGSALDNAERLMRQSPGIKNALQAARNGDFVPFVILVQDGYRPSPMELEEIKGLDERARITVSAILGLPIQRESLTTLPREEREPGLQLTMSH